MPKNTNLKRPKARIGKIITAPFLIFYRYLISPLLGNNCRFQPSCSEYAQEAYDQHNFWRASWLTFWRICRCNPWGGQGYDPVPECAKCKTEFDKQP
jgi:putative membrane protein insertion efficiency factor